MSINSQTVEYATLAALALDKLSDEISDAISTANAALYFYKQKGNWEGVSSGGKQLRKTLMYQLQTLRPLGSFGAVNVNPIDSHTSVYFDWVQTAVPVAFSDMEEFQTSGDEAIETIVQAKMQQAKASLDDFFSRALLQGQASIDGSSLTSPVTNPQDGSTFIDPLFKTAAYSTSGSLTIGGIDQSAQTFWKNQAATSAATTLIAFLAELRALHILTQRGGGGPDKAPDFHLVDERTYNVYEKALSLTHRNPDYQKADIPFENVAFKGKPVIPEELMPDVYSSTATVAAGAGGYGTWFMGNSAFMGFTYDKGKSFKMGPNSRPWNQLVTASLMPVRGTHWVNNRRKLGVLGKVALATLEAATS